VAMSVRSPVITAAAAVIGASAIVGTSLQPVQQPVPAVSLPSASAVTLVGFASPLSQLFGTLNMASNYLFSSADPTAANAWPYAQFGTYWGVPPAAYPVLPGILSENGLGGYSAVGVIPQIINDALPALSQLGRNGSDYLETTGNAVATAGIAISQGVWDFPSAVLTALQQAGAGDVTAALATLSAAILGPITTAGTALLAAGTYVLTGVTTRAAAFLAGLTAPRAYGLAVGGVPLLIRKAIAITRTVLTDLATLNVEGAWNAGIEGLLGPSGVIGMALNITIGAGVQTGPITSSPATRDELSANYIPGVRTAVQADLKNVAASLAVPNPAPPVPSPVVSSGAGSAGAGTSGAAARSTALGSTTVVGKRPIQHRVSRKTDTAADARGVNP